MALSFDVFWSFRSPYSYLATPRLVELERTYDVDINVRPVYPIAVRIPGFFKQVNPLWPPYLFKDTARIAQMEGIEYVWPDPDPVIMSIASGEVPTEQPYIHRLTRLGVAAAEQGKGLAFISEVSTLIWTGTKGWFDGDHLKQAGERAGVDLDVLDQTILDKVDYYEERIAENEAAQKDAGHWGVPLMVFDGEPFFGQDRISHLLWRMEQNGLTRR